MTVTYTAEVATCSGFGCFIPLLFRWRGSVYKLVWMDMFTFLTIYFALSFLYRVCLPKEHQDVFEKVVEYCNSYGSMIPISFVLGFYVQIVMTRWWDQYMSIPWPDSLAIYVSAHLHGQDERGRLMRRTVMRYVCLCLTMVLCSISPRVKKRFPTHEHLVKAGLLMDNEKEVIEHFEKKFPRYQKHWMCIVWASSIVTRARKEGRIRDDFSLKTIIDELNRFRGLCGLMTFYDAISIPLVYTQVVTLAVYSYFLCNVIGNQWIDRSDEIGYENIIDLYFPVFTTMEFLFYMGWLKVAESMINPFGEDDDDFEVNWIIDRNLHVAYLIVDQMHHEHPQLVKDPYYDERIIPVQNSDESQSQIAGRHTATISSRLPNGKPASLAFSNKNIIAEAHSVVDSKDISVIEMPSISSITVESANTTPTSELTSQVSSEKTSTTSEQSSTLSASTTSAGTGSEFDDDITIIPRRVDDTADVRELFKNKMKIASSITIVPALEDIKDDFERLRQQRIAERKERQYQRYKRSIQVQYASPTVSLRPSFDVIESDNESSTDDESVEKSVKRTSKKQGDEEQQKK